MKRILLSSLTILLIAIVLISMGKGHRTSKNNDVIIKASIVKKFDSPYVGTWSYAAPDSTEVFTLKITQSGSNLVGYYCDSFDRGKKMDCTLSDDPSFTAPVPTIDSCDVSYVSTYTTASGTVRLILSGSTNMIWKIIARPPGENYAPSSVTLTKQ